MKMKMKISSRITALILTLVFVISSFAGCGLLGIPTGRDIELDADALAKYKVIRSSSADDKISDATASFFTELRDITGSEIKVGEDWIKDVNDIPKRAKEIVIGSTNRPDGIAIEEKLGENDYAIVYKNQRIFIIGGSSEATLEAIRYFKENYLDRENKLIRINDKCEYISLFEYSLSSVHINGVSIFDYTIVIPSDADISEKYAALNLSDFLRANSGKTMNIVTDEAPEQENEILIGDTNRDEYDVDIDASLDALEYIFYRDGSKIICEGESFMVGGGIGDLISRIPTDGDDLVVNIDDIPTEACTKVFTFKEAKSAILMIGDGMGFNTIDMSLEQIGSFIANDLPNKGNSYTGSLTTASDPTKPTDSAAGGTALSTGFKTLNKYIGMDKDGKVLLNIRELANSKGANTGVISTDVITGATPSAFLAHNDSRNDSDVLREQIDALINAGEIDWCSGDIGKDLTVDTAAALRKLSLRGSSFFLMVEEGQIDKASHSNKMDRCIDMVERFNDDIAYVIQFVLCHPDTVLIITADHETGGIVKRDDGSFAYTLTEHSTVNVPVFAFGYDTEYFADREVDNTEIAKFMAEIFGETSFGQE